MGVKAAQELHKRVESNVENDAMCVCVCVRVCVRVRMCMCVCVCVCWVGSCPAIKLGWFHQLSAHLSPELKTLTRHFSYDLGTRTSLSLTHTSKHTHPNTQIQICVEIGEESDRFCFICLHMRTRRV